MAEKHSEKGERSFLARTASITSKRARRAQEKVKQKLGKANETKDLTFDEFVNNFNKQQGAAQRLHKELKNYYSCIKATLAANDAFTDAVKEVYEPEWTERDTLVKLLEDLHVNWTELHEKLYEEVLVPLTAYQSQFPDIKARINKRGRKLVDYDRCRHNFEALKSRGKSGDPKKVTQAEEEFNEAKTVYTKLHAELYEELPALFDSRIAYYVSAFQSIFTAEGVFHREAARIKTQLNDLMDGLVKEMSTGMLTTKRPYPTSSEFPVSDSDEADVHSGQPDSQSGEAVVCSEDGTRIENGEVAQRQDEDADADAVNQEERETVGGGSKSSEDSQDRSRPEPLGRPPPALPEGAVTKAQERPSLPPLPVNRREQPAAANTGTGKQEAVISSSPDSSPGSAAKEEASNQDEIPGVLYKVIACHKYEAEDDDELSFEKGETIHVVEFEDPEEQDEGWLMGIVDSTRLKGVFPANFTKRIT